MSLTSLLQPTQRHLVAMDFAIIIIGGLAVISSTSANYHQRHRSIRGTGPSGTTSDPLNVLERERCHDCKNCWLVLVVNVFRRFTAAGNIFGRVCRESLALPK